MQLSLLAGSTQCSATPCPPVFTTHLLAHHGNCCDGWGARHLHDPAVKAVLSIAHHVAPAPVPTLPMASAVFTGTVDFSTTILLWVETEAIRRAAPSQ